MTRQIAAAVLALLTATGAHAQAGACTATSGPGTSALAELYTSEGCSSCPPADRWLSTLRSSGAGPGRLVPLALHVDYWDYIGWKDPYARSQFSARQRELAAAARSRVVYTPQVMLAGKDYRGWSSRERFAREVAAVNAAPARAHITLALAQGAAGATALRAAASVPGAGDRADASLYVARYENGLSSRVSAGENRGATLTHDHVVREWWGPLTADAAGNLAFERALDNPPAQGGIAAFVQNRRTGEVLQALALPNCRNG
jgi:hypothetical protein